MAQRHNEPAYLPVLNDLREQIRNGARPLGSPLPKVPELVATYRGATDGIIRNALNKLHAEGLAYSKPGVGWFVTEILPTEYETITQSVDRLRGDVLQLAARVAELEQRLPPAAQPARPARRSGRPTPAPGSATPSAAPRSSP